MLFDVAQHGATREQLDNVEAKLDNRISGIENRMDLLRSELKTDIAELRTELKQDNARLEHKLDIQGKKSDRLQWLIVIIIMTYFFKEEIIGWLVGLAS